MTSPCQILELSGGRYHFHLFFSILETSFVTYMYADPRALSVDVTPAKCCSSWMFALMVFYIMMT